jgi:hypothetical protein
VITVVCSGRPGDPHRKERVLEELADERASGGGFRELPRSKGEPMFQGVKQRKADRGDALMHERIHYGRHRFRCPTCGRDRLMTDETLGKIVDAYGVANPRINIGALP